MNNTEHDRYMTYKSMLYDEWIKGKSRLGKDKLEDIVKDLRFSYMKLYFSYKRGKI